MGTRNRSSITTSAILAIATIFAFAANSILCRLVLSVDNIGAIEFTAIRLTSGAMSLWLAVAFLRRSGAELAPALDKSGRVAFEKSYLWPVIALFVHVLCFSLAYVYLPVSIGALILFATFKLTMTAGDLFQRVRRSASQWLGGVIALGGLCYAMFVGMSAPPLTGILLMVAAGISWGVYSLLAKNRPDPIVATARSFIFGLPGVAVLFVIISWKMFWSGHFHANAYGIMLAVISGALTSGIGYVLWYLALQRITATEASVTQLAVPALTALGGVLLLHEILTAQLIVATIVVLAGISLTIWGQSKTTAESAG